ncbi:MAG: patatin-like phospholipase family protein [Nitrospirae bacterium]|nr:patatin-like phospholipase family protein [Nitrospirota bacterium]
MLKALPANNNRQPGRLPKDVRGNSLKHRHGQTWREGGNIARVRLFLTAALCACLFLASCTPQEVKPQQKPVKIALVLGAGASRGFAHVGVLKILETNKIPVHMIIGTSAGSFVGSLYAYGFTSFQLQKIANTLDKNEIIDLTVPDNGFIKGERLEEYVNTMVKNTPLEKMRIPFYAVATNIQDGQETVFSRGNTGTAVRASCSIPGIFRPVKIDGRMYVDGGVVSPIAVDAARRLGADIVIAVDISSDIDARQPEGTVETILQAAGIMHSKISAIQLAKADVIIRPKVGRIGSADFDKRFDAMIEGEKAAIEMLPSIQAVISRLK